MIYSNSVNLRMSAFTHIFEHPAFYLWIGAFFVLGVIYDLSRLLGRKPANGHRQNA